MKGLDVTFAAESGGSGVGSVRVGHGIVDPRAIRLALADQKPDGVSWTQDGALTVWAPTVLDAQLAVSAAWKEFARRETIVLVRFLDTEDTTVMVTHVSLLRPAGPDDIPPEMAAKAAAVMEEQRKLMN